MTLTNQWKLLKENWLLIALAIVFLVFMGFGGIGNSSTSFSQSKGMHESSYDMAESMGLIRYANDDGFSPEIEERKITRTASMTTLVDKGLFNQAEIKLKDIISSTDSLIINENVRMNGQGKKAYEQGSYSLKIDTSKYDAIISQLKTIGEVTSFNENTQDITDRYDNAEINLVVEKTRLARYEQMYTDATRIEDKIELNDRIFNQERTIKYLEERVENMDEKIAYTTINFNLREEQPEYYNVTLIKFSKLIRNLVESINGLLNFIFIIIPWALVVGMGFIIWKRIKKK